MTQVLSAFLDNLEKSAHAASVDEENYRREVAARLKVFENERAFGFRRLNLMKVVIAAIENCETEDDAIVKGSGAFLREVGWSTESESQQESLEKFQPVIRACWQARQAEIEAAKAESEKAEGKDVASAPQVNPPDIKNQLGDFERWYSEARNGPFLNVLGQEVLELPLVEIC